MFSTMGGTWVGFGGDTCVLPGNWGSTRGSTWGGISPVEQGVVQGVVGKVVDGIDTRWVLGSVLGVVLGLVLGVIRRPSCKIWVGGQCPKVNIFYFDVFPKG